MCRYLQVGGEDGSTAEESAHGDDSGRTGSSAVVVAVGVGSGVGGEGVDLLGQLVEGAAGGGTGALELGAGGSGDELAELAGLGAGDAGDAGNPLFSLASGIVELFLQVVEATLESLADVVTEVLEVVTETLDIVKEAGLGSGLLKEG